METVTDGLGVVYADPVYPKCANCKFWSKLQEVPEWGKCLLAQKESALIFGNVSTHEEFGCNQYVPNNDEK